MLPLFQGIVWHFFFLICVLLLIDETQSEGRVVCYYTNWSVYRPGTAKFNPQNINPYLCTHLIYAFGGFTKDNTLKPFDKYQDIEQGGYAKFTGLKSYNKNLKTLLAIGGWNEASSRFSPLVANPERRQQFVKNILKFLRQNHFDGLDLDWEYPAHRDGGKSRDKDNYAQFVQELRNEFERESSKTGRPRLLLTMAVPAGIEYIEKGYDIPKLNKYLDWFNILSYDYHSAYEPSVNHHAPLFSLEEESEYNYDSELNIDYTVKFYLKAGADKNKLVLGIPTYGRSYTLINEESNDIGAPSDGPGEQGDATREKGYLAYYEICQNIREDSEWQVMQPNPKAMGPYAFKNSQWVGYDDEAIVRKKGEYVANNGLGGIMFWSIDNDDFRGLCTGKPYPLIEAAKEAYLDSFGLDSNEISKPSNSKKPLRSRSRQNTTQRNKISNTQYVNKDVEKVSRKDPTRRPAISRKRTTTETPTSSSSSLYIGRRTTTPEPPTTPDPGSDFKCEEEGFFQHPRDCKKYFWCLDSGPSNLGIVAHQFTCPSGLYFNPAADSCDFSRNVLCNHKSSKNSSKTTTTTTKPPSTTIPTTNRPKLTAATNRNSFKIFSSTTTTTEPAYEYEDEDEIEDEKDTYHSKDHDDIESEEDPKVIKELIDLIKKVGGIEELEKILQQDGDIISVKTAKSSDTATTEPTITKTLYDKVLRRPNSLRSFQNQFNAVKFDAGIKKSDNIDKKTEISGTDNIENKYSSVFRNSRPHPQNDGIEKLSEFSGFLKEKPKYVTITRTTPSVTNEEIISDEIIDHQIIKNDDIISQTQKPSTIPTYKTVQRFRPVTYYNKTKDLKEEVIKTEKKSFDKNESLNPHKNRYNEELTDDINIPEQINSSPASVNIIQRSKNPTQHETSTVNYETEDDRLSTQTVHIVDYKKNTTLSPTKANTFTTPRVYSNFSRTTTLSQPIKISVENAKTKQESISNSLNTTTLTPISFPLTTETIYTTANDIPTINTTPKALINPLNNNSVPNTTFLPILLNTTEIIGNAQDNETTETENIFDETETKANTTDKVLLTKHNKDIKLDKTLHYSSVNISVENSHTNNININNLNNSTLDNSSIKLKKFQKEKNNTDIDRTGETITISRPKSFDFRQRRPQPTPTTQKSSTISNFVISDSLSSTENEISSKEVSVFSPFNLKRKDISRNATVDLNLHSSVDSTKVEADIKNNKLVSSLKPARISHRKNLGNNNVIENVETRSMISKRYSWRDPRIGNYRPWHNKTKEIDNISIDEITNTESKDREYNSEETYNSNTQRLRRINVDQYRNRPEEDNSINKLRIKNYNTTTFQSLENEKLKENNEMQKHKQEQLEGQIYLKNYNFTTNNKITNTSNHNNSLSNSHKNQNNNNLNNRVSQNKNKLPERTVKNNTQVLTNVPEIYTISKRRKNNNSTQTYTKSKGQENLTTENVDFNHTETISSVQFYNGNINATINDVPYITDAQKNNSHKNGKVYNRSLITESDQIFNSTNGGNSLEYSSVNRLKLKTTTESSDADITTISDIKQGTLDSDEIKTNYTEISNNASTLAPSLKILGLTITTKKPENVTSTEDNISDKEIYNKLTTESTEIANRSSITNNTNSRKYSTIKRLKLKPSDDLTILDQTPENFTASGIQQPHDESSYNYSTLNRIRFKTTTEASSNDFAITESTIPTTESANDDIDIANQTQKVIDSDSVEQRSTRYKNIEEKQTSRYNKLRLRTTTDTLENDFVSTEDYGANSNKNSAINRRRLKTTTESVSDNLDILDNETKKNSTINRLHQETTTETLKNDFTRAIVNFVDTEEYKNSVNTKFGESSNSSTGTVQIAAQVRNYAAINKFRFNSSEDITGDDLTILEQPQESLNNSSTKVPNVNINYNDSILNGIWLKTTTETAFNDFTSTETNFTDEKEYDSNFTTESDSIGISHTITNKPNSRKYSDLSRLKTTTEYGNDKLKILDQTLDTNTEYNDSTLNGIWLKTTTEKQDNDIASTQNNLTDEQEYVKNNSTESVDIRLNSTINNKTNSHTYSAINRLRLKSTTSYQNHFIETENLENETVKSYSWKDPRIGNFRPWHTTKKSIVYDDGKARQELRTSNVYKILNEEVNENSAINKYISHNNEKHSDHTQKYYSDNDTINSTRGLDILTRRNKTHKNISRTKYVVSKPKSPDLLLSTKEKTESLNNSKDEIDSNSTVRTTKYVASIKQQLKSSTDPTLRGFTSDINNIHIDIDNLTDIEKKTNKSIPLQPTANKFSLNQNITLQKYTTKNYNNITIPEQDDLHKSIQQDANFKTDIIQGLKNSTQIRNTLNVSSISNNTLFKENFSIRNESLFNNDKSTTSVKINSLRNNFNNNNVSSFLTTPIYPLFNRYRKKNFSLQNDSKHVKPQEQLNSNSSNILDIIFETKNYTEDSNHKIFEPTQNSNITQLEFSVNNSLNDVARSGKVINYRRGRLLYPAEHNLTINSTEISQKESLKQSFLTTEPPNDESVINDRKIPNDKKVNDNNFTSKSEEISSDIIDNKNSNSRNNYTTNGLKLKTTTFRTDSDILNNTRNTVESNSVNLQSARLKYNESIMNSTLRLHTTTESPEKYFVNTEDYIPDKEGYNNYFTPEFGETSSSSTGNRNLRIYSNAHRLRLKTTTESVSDDSEILDQDQIVADSDSINILNPKINNNRSTKKYKLKRLLIKTTTDTAKNDSENTEDNIPEINYFTTESVEISDTSIGSNTKNSRKYFTINRLRLETATETTSDDSDKIEKTQKKLDLNSVKLQSGGLKYNETIKNTTSNRLRFQTTTETLVNDFVTIEENIPDKEGYNDNSTTESSEILDSGIGIKNQSSRIYSTVNRLKLKTTTESASEDSVILDHDQIVTDSDSIKLLNSKINNNEPTKKYPLNRLLIKTTTDSAENDFESTEDIADKQEYNKYFTTEPAEISDSGIGSNTKSSRNYSFINRLRLKTTTETTNNDSDILNKTQNSLDSNSLKQQSVRFKYNDARNNTVSKKLRFKTTTETSEDDVINNEDYIADKEVYSNNFTTEASVILSDNTVSSNTVSRIYSPINRLRLKTTTESVSDDSETLDQDPKIIDSDSIKLLNSKINNNESTQKYKLNRLLIKTTTDIAEHEYGITEDSISDKEGDNNYITTEPAEISDSSIGSNTKNSRNYSTLNRLRLKTTTETTSDDSDKIEKTQKKLDLNSVKLQSGGLKYNETTKNTTSNRLRFQTTTETLVNDFVTTEENISDKEGYNDHSTTESVAIFDSGIGIKNTNSRIYSTVNRLKSKTTTESVSDDSENLGQGPKVVDSNSIKLLSPKINFNESTRNFKLNRLLLKTTTDTLENDFASTEEYIANKTVSNYNATIESDKLSEKSIDKNSINSRNYSTINRLRLKTTTETTSDDSDILNKTENSLDSSSLKLQSTRFKYNEARNNTRSNKLQLKTTTETSENDFVNNEDLDKEAYNNNFTTESAEVLNSTIAGNNITSRIYSPTNRLRLRTTTESVSDDSEILDQDPKVVDSNSIKLLSPKIKFNESRNNFKLNRLLLRTTTDTLENDFTSTEEYIANKTVSNYNATIESDKLSEKSIDKNNINSRNYSTINRLRLKTTTETTSDDSDFFNKTENSLDSSSLKLQSTRFKYNEARKNTTFNKLRLKTTTETSEDDFVNNEDYSADKERYNNSFTTESAEVLNSTISGNNITSRIYSPINRLKLKTTTESVSDDSEILDQDPKVVDSNSIKLLSPKIKFNESRNNFKLNRLLLRTTTDTLENDFASTEEYIANKTVSNYNATIESDKLSEKSIDKNSINSRNYSTINRLRLKTTTETTSDDSDFFNKTENSLDSSSLKLQSTRFKYNEARKNITFNKLRLKTTTETSENDFVNNEDLDKEAYNNNFTTESAEVLSSTIAGNNITSRKYSPINRLKLKTTTESVSDGSEISDNDQKVIDSDSIKLLSPKINYIETTKNYKLNRLLQRTTTETSKSEFAEEYTSDKDDFNSIATTESTQILSNKINFQKYSPINRLRLKTTTEYQSDNSDNFDQTQKTIDSSTGKLQSARVKYSKATKSSSLNIPSLHLTTETTDTTDNIANNQVYTNNSTYEFDKNSTSKSHNTNKYFFKRPKTNIELSNDNNKSIIIENQNITANKEVVVTIDLENNVTSNNKYAKLNRPKISTDTETDNSTIIGDKVLILENITKSTDSFDNNTMRLYKNYNRSEDNDIHFSNITNPHLNLIEVENVENNTNNITFDKNSGINIKYLNGFKNNITESKIQHINNVRRFQKGNTSSTSYKEKDVNITNEFHSTTSDGRRLRVLKLKRPISNSLSNNTLAPVNRTLNDFENDYNKTQTEIGEKNYTRKLIRKRPVIPISTTENNVTQPNTPAKYIRRIIKKIKRPQTNISETTTNNNSVVNPELSNINTDLLQEQNFKPTSKNDDTGKTFVSRRLYRPAIAAKENKTIEKSTSDSYTRKINRNYFGLKTTTERIDNNSTNFNSIKVDNKILTSQTFKDKVSDPDEFEEDYNEDDDEENVDKEYNDDESDDEENDDEEGNDNKENKDNEEPRPKIILNSLLKSTPKPRNTKIRNNYANKLKNTTSNNLTKFGNSRANFPTNPNKINQNKQPYNVLGKLPSKRPRVINRPIFTTPYPSQNQIELTNFSPPTTPSVFRSTNTRTYERKYFPSSTENSSQETPQDNPLLEELNIDALNARNKKIFEITSKKHTTSKPKPLLTEQQSTTMEKNTTSESDTQYNTPSNIIDYTEIKNLNHSQDALIEHTTLQLSPENSTTNTEITTLKHIFAIDEEDEPTTMRIEFNESYHSENEGKIVEINRVIEISSQEQKLKQKNKNIISGSNDNNNANTDLKIETPSHVDKLGEISRVKFVKLVESNSTDTDYSSTELLSKQFVTERNSILDKSNKKSYIKKERQLILPEVIRGVETSTISLEGLFDSARKSKKLELINGPVFASSLGEIYTKKGDNENNLTTTEDTIKNITTSQNSEVLPIKVEENSTTIVDGTTVTERNHNYVRPIVPLLRPESNESSPLVISIANLDKVILSKISKTDSNVADSAPISQVVEAPKFLKYDTSVINYNDTNQGHTNIIEETLTSFSSQTSIVKPKFRQSLHRPFSARRRLTTASNLPKYSSTNLEKVTTTPLLDENYTTFNRRINRIYQTTTPKTTSTHRPTHKFLNRRAFVRPENRRSTTINLYDTTPFESTTVRYRTSTNAPLLHLQATTINIDQEAGSSIQETKFTKNNFNIVVKNLDGEESKTGNKKEILSSIVPNSISTTRTPQFTDSSANENKKFRTSSPKTKRPKAKEREKVLKSINIQSFDNNNRQFSEQTYRPIIDYDYYDEEDVRVVSKKNALVKVILHSHGAIECLDQGNFPHPLSCRKFISCAKMGKEDGGAIGWEYTCPKGLSYDPVGGICNWSSGLGCKE